MPVSKRARVVPTSKTKKNRKELVRKLHVGIQTAADQYNYIWVFDVQNMRNSSMKDVRSQLSDSRIFMGKTKLMLHALGSSPESAHLPGTHLLSPYMTGEIGLLFTSRSPAEILSYFANHVVVDYARAGTLAPREFVIPPGELRTQYDIGGDEGDLLPMGVEPTLRKLGVPTNLVKGKIVLEQMEDAEANGHLVCSAGDVLDSRQTTLLKIFGVRMAEFKITPKVVWEKENGTLIPFGDTEVDNVTT